MARAVADDSQDPDALDLNDELAKKYDPERLLQIVGKRAGNGDPLDASVRNKYERRFGVDLGHVRVFTGEFAEEFNRRRDAYAVTIANTGMVMMGGSPDKSMASASGQALLAHELTHVSQAQRGLHFALEGGESQGAAHEREAEAVEQEVHATETAQAAKQAGQARRGAGGVDRQQVLARVLELVGEWERTQAERLGRG